MKKDINPAVAGVILTIALILGVVFLSWEYFGPRTDGPKEPIDMAKMMNKSKLAPPAEKGPQKMGGPKR